MCTGRSSRGFWLRNDSEINEDIALDLRPVSFVRLLLEQPLHKEKSASLTVPISSHNILINSLAVP